MQRKASLFRQRFPGTIPGQRRQALQQRLLTEAPPASPPLRDAHSAKVSDVKSSFWEGKRHAVATAAMSICPTSLRSARIAVG
jgi:hypothetical protein